ncbi:histone-lysine N-methyltransferase EHMT1a [Lampris incognitus]|uniref:histone-lysine N-methyltransferase EHMT1a n=1 Tax=Lampris incognitus TaxID=2546036 RepID=UPI0024B62E49|nr:histone-lysine N-methyltransferase EHMT1a [Lampris incognitus]XP_056149790.1 histone-lysine N-methyltransferase EHMT1a [Lampris incognitus]
MGRGGVNEGPGPGRRPSKLTSGAAAGAKGQRAQSGQMSQIKITNFLGLPVASNVHEKVVAPAAAAESPEEQAPCSTSEPSLPPPKTKATGKSIPRLLKSLGRKGAGRGTADVQGSETPSQLKIPHCQKDKGRTAVSPKALTEAKVVKRKKRKMGMYNLVPKKKAKVLKQLEKKQVAGTSVDVNTAMDRGKPEVSAGALAAGELKAVGEEPQAEAYLEEGLRVEYTELALDSLDLKAQEELLSPPLSGLPADSEATETDLAEELPLCCCRMETPSSGGGLSVEQTCMATESMDGMVSRCQRRVMKQEMMRPSNTVHLLVLCEDHRAGMVKHQCCPGCGLFCRVGTFLECRPYGSISHRFHRGCTSILKDRQFCPHCGEDASRAKEVTVLKPDPVPSIPKLDPGPALPAVPAMSTVPSLPAMAVVPQILRAKKTSDPHRTREHGPDKLKADSLSAGDKLPTESLESILMALDDENMNPKKMMYPTKQLYLSAKQGELQKVIHLLVDGKDPNFSMESQNKRTPLHAAAAEGHQEICHMLVQAGANLDSFDDEQRTPLMTSCENNHLDTVKYLLRAGAAVGRKDIKGSTCLHVVAKLGYYDIFHHLLSKASRYINCQDDGGWTPITWAIEYKHMELVHLLLARGADVNIRDKEENVCLHWAALAGCDDIAQALLDSRCDLHAVNIHGDSPLHVAVRENHLECVMLFLSRGADVSLRNREGETALDCCSQSSKVWNALNTNKKLTDARKARDCRGERVLSRDISRGYEAIPINCVNGIDDEPCPDGFKYIPDSCISSPLNIDKDITHLQHCTCTDDCSSSTCMCAQLSLCCWYDSEGRLPLDFCQREPPVLFECNHACSCWRTCRNRVVQNGLRARLQLYRTQKMGWGVRALQDIPQGTFICEYVGEIITDAEADKRENDSFLFTLDNKVGDVHCIDARLFGNIGRFINHLCEPNLLAIRVFTMHQDLRFPRIAFFSSRPIQAGDQIGFDYGDYYWKIKGKYFGCQCGSPKCRHLPTTTAQTVQNLETLASTAVGCRMPDA